MTRTTIVVSVVVAVAAATLTALTLQPDKRRGSEVDPAASVPPAMQVAVALPLANRIALVDAAAQTARFLEPIPDAAVDAPSQAVQIDDRLLVVGTAGGRVAVIDAATGELRDTRSFFYDSAWYVSRSPGGEVFIAADTGSKGVVYKLDPLTLAEETRVTVGPGQAGMAFEGSRLWTIADEASPSFKNTSFSIVDTGAMKAESRLLPGQPEGIARLAPRRVGITLTKKDKVVLLRPSGKQAGAVRGFERPWGIAPAGDGTFLVVAQGRDGSRGAVHIVRTSDLRVIRRVRLPGRCGEAREVIVPVSGRAVVTCVGLPGVGVVDLSSGKVTLLRLVPPDMESFAEYEQPRGLSLVGLD